MIGYYIHHHGRGHLSRARTIADALEEPVTGLSSLRRPNGWRGEWIDLPLDVPAENSDPVDPDADTTTAHGRLHWVPPGVPGLRQRMARISAWIDAAHPAAVVVDVSVEVIALARLHGVPVVSVLLPGVRTDAAHRLGLELSDAVLAAWPAGLPLAPGAFPESVRKRVHEVGPITRSSLAATGSSAAAGRPQDGRARSARRVLVLGGAGGDGFTRDAIAQAQAQTPEWTWTHVGASAGQWHEDPSTLIRDADVVVTHAGQNAIAEVSAARVPTIIVPQDRPFSEQVATAAALDAARLPALIEPSLPTRRWNEVLDAAARLDGAGWGRWNDGQGAVRAACVIADIADASAREPTGSAAEPVTDGVGAPG